KSWICPQGYWLSPAVNTVVGLACSRISLVARSAVVLVAGSALMSPAPMIWFQVAGAPAAVPARRALVASLVGGVRRSGSAAAGRDGRTASNETDSMQRKVCAIQASFA